MTATHEAWEQFSSSLRAFIRRRVQDEHVAEDLLQEVFVKIHSRINTLQDQERMQSWLFQVARNVVTDHYRRQGRTIPEVGGEAATDLADEARAPENRNDEINQWLVEQIDLLPEEYRTAVSLAELQGIKQAAISEQIGLSLSGTKSRIQRGRQMLKDRLLECCHVEFDRKGNVIDYQRQQACCRCCDPD